MAQRRPPNANAKETTTIDHDVQLTDFVYRNMNLGSWSALKALTVGVELDERMFKSLFSKLRLSRVRRIRIVVCIRGNFFKGFEPKLLDECLKNVPYLEELVLDQMYTAVHSPLPGALDEWGNVLRKHQNLNVLTLPSVLIVDEEAPAFDDSDSADANISPFTLNQYRQSSMVESTTQSSAIPKPPVPHAIKQLHLRLSIFAELFMDRHLKMSTFKEIRFLLPAMDCRTQQECRVLRFAQHVDHDVSQGNGRYHIEWLGEATKEQKQKMLFWLRA